MHGRNEEQIFVASQPLCVQQGEFGVADQAFGVRAVAGRQRDAGASPAFDFCFAEAERFAHPADDFIDELRGVALRLRCAQQNREFVGAGPKRVGLAPEAGDNPLGGPLQ